MSLIVTIFCTLNKYCMWSYLTCILRPAYYWGQLLLDPNQELSINCTKHHLTYREHLITSHNYKRWTLAIRILKPNSGPWLGWGRGGSRLLGLFCRTVIKLNYLLKWSNLHAIAKLSLHLLFHAFSLISGHDWRNSSITEWSFLNKYCMFWIFNQSKLKENEFLIFFSWACPGIP